MKSISNKSLPALFVLSLFFSFQLVYAQEWHPPVELVHTGFDNESPQIAVSDNMVHVVWVDWRNTSTIFGEIYYKRSTDYGLTWEPGIKLSNTDGLGTANPKIALNNENIHIIWTTYSGSSQLYHCMSTDGGVTFNNPFILSSGSARVKYGDLAVFDSEVHIIWNDKRLTGAKSIYYVRSKDGGASWDGEELITAPGQIAYRPQIAASGEHVFVSWNDQINDPSEILFMRSLDGGDIWEPPLFLANTSSSQSQHDLAIFGEHDIHIVWKDGRDKTSDEIYYMKSTDAGMNWSEHMRLTFDQESPRDPSIAVVGDRIQLAWSDADDKQIYYLYSFDGGIEWSVPMRLSESADLSIYPSIAAFDDDVYVVWQQGILYYQDIYFRRNLDQSAVEEAYKNPHQVYLSQNYPNPFCGNTSLGIYLPDPGSVILSVYNSSGKKTYESAIGKFLAGEHSIEWNAEDLPAGIYYYQVDVISQNNVLRSDIRKMILY